VNRKNRGNRIVIVIISALSALAVCFISFFGVHYFFHNPFEIVLPADMKPFTVVNGGDVTAQDAAKAFRAMKRSGKNYARLTESAYCAPAKNTYDELESMMRENGYMFIGTDGGAINMRCFYTKRAEGGFIKWVRVETDASGVWAVWNFSSAEPYNLEVSGYKTMDN